MCSSPEVGTRGSNAWLLLEREERDLRVAVTGAGGFIGRRLCERLREEGHVLRLLTRHVERDARGGDEVAFWDATQPPAPSLLEGCDALVSLAGEPVAQRWTREVKERIRDSRVRGTAGLVEAMRGGGTVRTLVCASAVGYYGDAGERVLTEESPPGDDFLAQVCVAWEAEAQRAEALGARVVRLRFGVVLHPEGGVLHKVLPLFRAGVGGRLGSGRQVMSWVHREDVVSLVLFALGQLVLSGPVNATAPHPVTNAHFTHALAERLGRPALVPVPALALRLTLGEAAGAVLSSQHVLPQAATRAGFSFRFPHLEEALRHLLA